MHLSRNVTLGAIAIMGTALAACWVIGGLWMIFDLSRAIRAARWVVVIAGIGGIAAGEFVFLVCVADRLFPRMGRRLWPWAVEMALFGVFMVCYTLGVLVLVWSVAP